MRGARARIAVPYSRKFLFRASGLIFLVYIALYGVYHVIAPIVAWIMLGTGPDLLGYLCSGGVALGFFVAAIQGLRVWLRARRQQTVIELDSERLTIFDLDDSGKPRQRWWYRRDVADVRPGPVPWTAPEVRGLGLHIRIAGKTILEVMPGHPREVAQWVADRLNEALSASPTAENRIDPVAHAPDGTTPTR